MNHRILICSGMCDTIQERTICTWPLLILYVALSKERVENGCAVKTDWPTAWQNAKTQKKNYIEICMSCVRCACMCEICNKFKWFYRKNRLCWCVRSLGLCCFESTLFCSDYLRYYLWFPFFNFTHVWVLVLSLPSTSFNIVASHRIFSRVVTCTTYIYLEFVFFSIHKRLGWRISYS